MRSTQKLILAFTLALGATSVARAQDSLTHQGQQAQPFGFWQQETQPSRELTYKEWKNSDEAREFGRSEYSGKITNR
jgi:Spy/CpxP family protein refolding chaperone